MFRAEAADGPVAVKVYAEASAWAREVSLRNVLFDPVRHGLVAVLDFATAAIGDPVYDLAKLPWVDLAPGDVAGRERYLAGWERRSRAAIDRDAYALYVAVQGIAAMAWVDRRGGVDQGFRQRGRARDGTGRP